MEKTIDEKLDLILENQEIILKLLKPILDEPKEENKSRMDEIKFSTKKRE